MQRTVTINKNTYTIPEVTFDAICQLEENGVYLLSMGSNERNLATMLRGLVAWIMDTDLQTASREIQAHIMSGGNIGDILEAATDSISDAGFFKQVAGAEETEPAEVQEFQPNREQRRHPNKQQSQNNQPRNTHR